METTFKEKSSHTADGVAYRRLFTDIPLAKEIWDILAKSQGRLDDEQLQKMMNRRMLSFFEARYLKTDIELQKSGIKQILELAPGFSSRGIVMAEDPDVVYVELDLAGKMNTKKEIVAELVKRGQAKHSPNLFFEEGNVVNVMDFMKAASHFRTDEPVAVICEGLLRYISFDDKKILLQEIHKLISRAGGAFITPDIEFLNDVDASPQKTAEYNQVAQDRGFDVRPNIFREEDHAISFFESFGFKVEKYALTDMIPFLACPEKAGLTPEEVAAPLKNRWTYVMTANK
jgi:O-methyltransferase involved in polyketide biosynthesis